MSFGGEAALSVEARYLEADLPIELHDAYAQTFDRLRRMFRARGCSGEEAADLAQEAAVRAFLHIRRWGVTDGGLDPLLNRIARNLLIDRYRRVAPHLVPLENAGEIHDPAQDPTEEVARRQRRHAVQSAIRALPTRHQKAINYSLSGMSPAEVGRRLGIGRNAADALLHRARRSLKEHLAPVREGMWGFALAARVRWDRVTRRAGVDVHAAETGGSILMQSGIGAVAVAVIATFGIFGGAGGSAAGRGAVPAFGPVVEDGAAGVEAVPPASPASGRSGEASGGGSSRSYRIGPASGTWGPDEVEHRVAVPDPNDPSGPPLLDAVNRIWRNNNGPQVGPETPKVDVSPILCDLAQAACSGDGDA